jgi:hypothetical protein
MKRCSALSAGSEFKAPNFLNFSGIRISMSPDKAET